jgi:hypothetical protein
MPCSVDTQQIKPRRPRYILANQSAPNSSASRSSQSRNSLSLQKSVCGPAAAPAAAASLSTAAAEGKPNSFVWQLRRVLARARRPLATPSFLAQSGHGVQSLCSYRSTRCLTLRSRGGPTAGHQAWATVCSCPFSVAQAWRPSVGLPLNSNVRPHSAPMETL